MRKDIFIFLGAIFAWAALSMAGAPRAEESRAEMTLQNCIDRGLRENLDIRSASLGLRRDQWEIERQKSVFDPSLTGQTSYERSNSPNYTSYIPVAGIESKNSRFNLGISKKLSTGAQLGFGYATSRAESNIETQNYSGSFSFTLSQPLLNGFGKKVTNSEIYIARLTGEETEWGLRDQAATLVYTIESSYWNLVYAIESLDVARSAVAQAESLLTENEVKMKLGMKTESEVLESKSAVIDREQDVLDREKTARDTEAELARLINLDGSSGNIVPTDRPEVGEVDLAPEQLLRDALKSRPDYLSAQAALNKSKLQEGVARNGLFPSLDLTSSYRLNGSDDTYGGSLDNISKGETNGWGLGLTLSYPIGNRASKATHEKSVIEVEKAGLALRTLEQSMEVEIRAAVRDVELQRSKIEAMILSIEVNQKKLDKEMERYQKNMSTSYMVLVYQNDLANARMQHQKALVDYTLAVAKLNRLSGNILDGINITVIGGKS